MYTYQAKKKDLKKKWHLMNAQGKILGRFAVEIASILRGKNKPIYTPHVDTGDYVVVINVEKINLTGKKLENKIYYHHSGYPGGIKSITASKLLATKPKDILRLAVQGMLPKNSLGRMMLKKLKIYIGNKHKHEAQLLNN